MIGRILLLILFFTSNITFGQMKGDAKIMIEARPVDPKKGYMLEIIKGENEVKIYQKRVDSIGKISFSEIDKKIMRRLISRANLDSLTKDSIDYYQYKMDSLRTRNTYYKTDSASIFKSSHPNYWKSLETVLLTPNMVLEKKNSTFTSGDQTYCFFSFNQNNQERQVFIDSLDLVVYPILTKLVNDTVNIMKAHKQVMERKH